MCRTLSRLPLAAAAIAAATAITACGSSSTSSSSSSSSSGASTSATHLTDAQAQQALVDFAGCVRSHGVPGFPDPSSPRQFKSSFAGNQQSPAFQSAAKACQHLLPGGGPGGQSQPAPTSHAQVVAELAFARCLRSHGFPGFPDPSSTGELSYQMIAGAGIDIHQPAALRAADACVGVTHGVLTRADVARFVAEH